MPLGVSSAMFVSLVIGSLAGGAFGAAIGALPAFCFTGFAVMAGTAGGTNYVGLIGFGPVFGPHVSFAGGAAAAAYAAKKGYMDTDFPYHEGKNIPHALGNKPDVLAVGAIFGLFGMISRRVLITAGAPLDQIAITVFISALLHRVVFGYSLIGDVAGSSIFDMGPFEREEMRDSSEVATDGGAPEERLATEVWLGHQYKWGEVTAIGIVTGILGAYAALATGSPFLGFGISAASLTFLNLGVAQIPVTHHMTLPGATAYMAYTESLTMAGDASLTSSAVVGGLVAAGVFGALGAILGEVIERIFYAHGDTHVDPPAGAIAACTLIISLLATAGVFPSSSWVLQL